MGVSRIIVLLAVALMADTAMASAPARKKIDHDVNLSCPKHELIRGQDFESGVNRRFFGKHVARDSVSRKCLPCWDGLFSAKGKYSRNIRARQYYGGGIVGLPVRYRLEYDNGKYVLNLKIHFNFGKRPYFITTKSYVQDDIDFCRMSGLPVVFRKLTKRQAAKKFFLRPWLWKKLRKDGVEGCYARTKAEKELYAKWLLKEAERIWFVDMLRYTTQPVDFKFDYEPVRRKARFKVNMYDSYFRNFYLSSWDTTFTPHAAAHEIGHMLGLNDEYYEFKPRNKDCDDMTSLMCNSDPPARLKKYHYYIVLRRLWCG
ncbi:MAG: hypothetical protein A2583_12635 [Bdellovibrionales bacterium RIFOXYD1_FULL_53_11]|nr:MAG: hypothetical protein A2583_12635 [Bdellovibrionales bacterium RIFOXYD1_FULL_53_11]